MIDHDGNVFTPLTDMTITGVYKVTKDDGTEAESDEISIVVPDVMKMKARTKSRPSFRNWQNGMVQAVILRYRDITHRRG